ncbi:unnamed protein product [Phytophthora fragariaefolia]|uniref:Unnamed protein product n=1 Tax=Phytophthora fragariaefolia TaxID=1490495 RepID=A0A9W6U7Z0_9STRA|nr:unnamed protein product [Phytophthora fragariaefolia]
MNTNPCSAEAEKLNRLQLILQQGGEVDNEQELVAAAKENQLDVLRFLVHDCGADVEVKTDSRYRALNKAAAEGHLEVVRFLVNECGASVNRKPTILGWTPLMIAAGRGHLDVVRFFVDECGANVNTKGGVIGVTPLMEAAEGGHLEVVRFLVIDCGAIVNTKHMILRSTALILAAGKGHTDVVRFLVNDCGADTDTSSLIFGETALLMAAKGGHYDVVRFLVNDCGADVNAKHGILGWNPLMEAAREGHCDVVRFLVNDSKANIHSKDAAKETALMKAAERGHLDVVQFLVCDGDADVSARNRDENTVLMMAAEAGHIDVVEFLVNNGGADANAKNKSGKTATRLAVDRGYYDVARLLTQFVSPERQPCIEESAGNVEHTSSPFDRSSSSFIDPAEVELGELTHRKDIGGDFYAKWLDADVVAKLFIPDASHSTLEHETRVWHKLRHPNVIKLYGVCQAESNVNFLVCEYASQGSLAEYVKSSFTSGSAKPPRMWKYLYEAALGLAYLHNAKIVHGDLRCSNILIGSDELAKLSNFGLAGVTKKSRSTHGVVGSTHWLAPEVLEGKASSLESDVYSLGMCILEAETGKKPWSTEDDFAVKYWKRRWNKEPRKSVPYDESDYYNPDPDPHDMFVRKDAPDFVQRSRELVWHMCCREPRQRKTLSSVVKELEVLSIKESLNSSRPQLEPSGTITLGEYRSGQANELWIKLQTSISETNDMEIRQLFDKLKLAHNLLQESEQSEHLLDHYYSLITDLYETVTMTPEEAHVLELASTQATNVIMYSFGCRMDSLLHSLRVSSPRPRKLTKVISRISAELKTLVDSSSRETQWKRITQRLPVWFFPMQNLNFDKGNRLGAGAFGTVHRAKWLDSEVVVKTLILPGLKNASDVQSYHSSISASIVQAPTDWETKHASKLTEFHQEADTWYKLSHPHVVRLFGACHIGKPFFVCEYATQGTLVNYLREHPDELWTKLHEAALGVQYIHARRVVHGDLKGNNIVVGSDLKAKVTDFGLSFLAGSEHTGRISGAWHWVAPECLIESKAEEAEARAKPTFESDVYSLGMCIVEAMRVIEGVRSGDVSYRCLPWGGLDNTVVKYHATKGKLPPRPTCEDSQWELVKRMCSKKPEDRIKISAVVDELKRMADESTDTNNQDDHAIEANDVNMDHTTEGLAVVETRKLLTKWQVDTRQRSESLIVLYSRLWEHVEYVRGQITNDANFAACWSVFHFLVGEAQRSTTTMKDMDNKMISLTQTTMRCYALHRRLNKLCDVYFLERFKTEHQAPSFADTNFHGQVKSMNLKQKYLAWLTQVGKRRTPKSEKYSTTSI